MTQTPPRTLRERVKRMLSPNFEDGALVGRAEMDAVGWVYLLVLLVFVIPLIPFLLVAHVLNSMIRSFYDPFRRPNS